MAPGLAVASGPCPFAAALAVRGWPVHRHPRDLRSTVALLESAAVAGFLSAAGRSELLVFKSSHRLEVLARARGWRILAPPARLTRRWENKVAFLELASALGLPVPEAVVCDPGEAEYAALAAQLGGEFVAQAAHGFGGVRTLPVASARALEAARGLIRGPQARFTRLVGGASWTQTGCVTGLGVALGPPAFQITGEARLTPRPMGSCGNDWTVAPPVPPAHFDDITRRIGVAMAEAGHLGLFGVDFVVADDGLVYVVEVNPRLVASVGLEADLDVAAGRMPLIARHLLAFLGPDMEAPAPAASPGPLSGGQVIVHNRQPVDKTVARNVAPGAHRVVGETLTFVGPALTTAVLGSGEWLVLPAPMGRRLAPGGEAGRLLRRGPVVDSGGRLHEDAVAAAAALMVALGLEA